MTVKMLSIVIPVFNEEHTLQLLLDKLQSVVLINDIQKQIIIVNDASSDQSRKVILDYMNSHKDVNIEYFEHKKNQGKGAALKTGFSQARGEYVVIQDADLEYDPQEFNLMLKPIVDGFADVVYGSRFMGSAPHRILFFWHTIGNKFITFLSNMFTNLNLTDIETCYKMFNTKMLKSLNLREDKFGIEPEMTAKISRIPRIRIYEVGISYYGRTYQEGKKIGWKDGFRASYCILKYGLFRLK